MSEMKVWPTIHTLLVQFAPRIAEAEAASSYDERIAIINGVSAHIAGKVEEQIDARLRSMEEALKPFAVEGRAWRHEFEARGDCRIRIGRNDINEHFATGILMSDFVRANAAISGEGQ